MRWKTLLAALLLTTLSFALSGVQAASILGPLASMTLKRWPDSGGGGITGATDLNANGIPSLVVTSLAKGFAAQGNCIELDLNGGATGAATCVASGARFGSLSFTGGTITVAAVCNRGSNVTGCGGGDQIKWAISEYDNDGVDQGEIATFTTTAGDCGTYNQWSVPAGTTTGTSGFVGIEAQNPTDPASFMTLDAQCTLYLQ